MDRRSFLIGAGALGGAALSGGILTGCGPPPGSILNLPASSSPIDHVVVLMMENRSFDHWLGWLGADDASSRVLTQGLERFAASPVLHARFLDRVLKDEFSEGADNVFKLEDYS